MSGQAPDRPKRTPTPRGILAGSDEKVFQALPTSTLENMRRARDESAVLWNVLYPKAQPHLSFRDLLALRPLWGRPAGPDVPDDDLQPFYWGFSIDGERMSDLPAALEAVAGREDLLEVDLLLVGRKNLVVIEAKNLASAGQCGRYLHWRCPEIHRTSEALPLRSPPLESSSGGDKLPGNARGCRYWEEPSEPFARLFDFGSRPSPESDRPPCADHYQLARCLLLARELARRIGRQPHLWLIVPQARWPEISPTWLSFAERVEDDEDWRGLRVLAWEAIQNLGTSPKGARR